MGLMRAVYVIQCRPRDANENFLARTSSLRKTISGIVTTKLWLKSAVIVHISRRKSYYYKLMSQYNACMMETVEDYYTQ